MDSRENKSGGDLPSSNTPTLTDSRFRQCKRDTSVPLARKEINKMEKRDGTEKLTEREVFEFEVTER